MGEERKYNYIKGVFDIISKEVRNIVLDSIEEGKALGVGVLTDELYTTTLCSKPLKPLEHRMQIAQGLAGVTFVFPIDSNKQEDMDRAAEEAYQNYINAIKTIGERKKYKVGFVIGSFDVLHAGHIENIELASNVCEDLYVVLKSDERITQNKGKAPIQNTTERAAVLKMLKQVRDVLYMDLDSTREDVIQDVVDTYLRTHPGVTLERKEIAAVFGEDLAEKEYSRRDEWGDVNIVITERPPAKMEQVSSSAYRGQIGEGGLKKREDIEAANLITSGRTESNTSGETIYINGTGPDMEDK